MEVRALFCPYHEKKTKKLRNNQIILAFSFKIVYNKKQENEKNMKK